MSKIDDLLIRLGEIRDKKAEYKPINDAIKDDYDATQAEIIDYMGATIKSLSGPGFTATRTVRSTPWVADMTALRNFLIAQGTLDRCTTIDVTRVIELHKSNDQIPGIQYTQGAPYLTITKAATK